MDVKVNTKMSHDSNNQHELLKTALEATDAYLGVEKQAVAAKKATPVMIHDFTYHMSRAHDTLKLLGVLKDHEEYMTSHVTTMSNLFGYSYSDVQEDAVVSFASFIAEENEEATFTEAVMDEIVEGTTWEDIVDLYSEEELVEEEEVTEALSAQARLKKKQSFSRNKSRRNVARGLKLRRASSPDTLKRRAMAAARRAMYKRLLSGRNKSSLSASEKNRVEMQVSKMKNIQSSIVNRMMPKIRSLEQSRLAHYRSKK
jgi:hypothetical protein